MKSLLFVLLLAGSACAELPIILPEEIKSLPDAEYQQVIKQFNAEQYAIARSRATSTTVEYDTSTTIGGRSLFNIYGSVGSYYAEPYNSTTTTYSRIYELNRYGGGPVWMINPYTRVR